MCRLPSGDIHLFIKDFNWRIKIKYAIITYDGSPASIAAQLLREGNVVLYAQVENPKDLGVDSGLSQEETPEAKKRNGTIASYANIGKQPALDFRHNLCIVAHTISKS